MEKRPQITSPEVETSFASVGHAIAGYLKRGGKRLRNYATERVPGCCLAAEADKCKGIGRRAKEYLEGKRKREPTSSTFCRTKFSDLQRIALEALYKDSRYPTRGVLEQFAELYNLNPRTVRIWFNNKRQRGNNTEGDRASVDNKVTELN